ncbi:DUF2793 domain-containing protein [Aminobacter niigataensis]|uniref:DUF2793 domain-containing protein n=1 Tax=Aminobacter niigataensis TaxID=83265 RepID=UPI0024C67CFE|nr:DUF2793 domain-containing protein [Aminobacter niigataensis]CAI2935736.1 conserved protein of unknown function [Aminobacter niigataensis]
MEQTTNLKMPFIMPSQAQKHVTHNEALQALDVVVQLSVLDRNLAAPPALPAEGDRYIVAAAASGGWAGKIGQIAAWQDGAWAFHVPVKGWLAWVADEQRILAHDGTGWVDTVALGVNPAAMVGVNTTADTSNRLSVKSQAVLFDNLGAGQQVKINKATAGDNASLLFQTGYSGRAEFGLAGDDDWHLKVSPDGGAWTEAIKVNRSDGRVLLPAGLALTDQNQAVAKRHVRTANRSYFVRTDGSDGNNGLANTSGGAFLTIQKALNAAASLDMAGFTVTIQVADGTYSDAIIVPAMTGQAGPSALVIAGNGGTPANVIVSTSNANAISAPAGTGCLIKDMEVRTTASGFGLDADGGTLRFQNVRFGACAQAHILCQNNGAATATGSYAISGASPMHWSAQTGGIVNTEGRTVTLAGTPAFATAFASCQHGEIACAGMTFSGAATGTRYGTTLNGVINTAGGGATYLPGSVAGVAATGGQYA